MKATNEYLRSLQNAVSLWTNAQTEAKVWAKEMGEKYMVEYINKLLPLPLNCLERDMTEDVMDEVCSAGREQIPFFLERMKDKGMMIVFDEVARHLNDKAPSVGGEYEEAWERLHDRIIRKTEALVQMVRQAEEKAKVKKKESILEVRERDLEGLRVYFNSQFKGAGMGLDKFAFDFVPAMRRGRRTKKDYARIAYLIYNNRTCTNRMKFPAAFTEFYRDFCEVVGCEFSAEYKPNKLKEDMGSIKQEFAILLQ